MAHGILHGVKHGIVHGIKHGDLTLGAGLQIAVIAGQSNGNGWAFVANQISVPNISFANSTIKMIDHEATVNGDPLVWTFDRPVSMTPPLPDPSTVIPVSISPRTGDSNGDAGVELALLQRLNRAQPGRWAVAKMCIPSSSMLNWETNADGSTYPTTPPHLTDQWTAWLTFIEQALKGKVAFVVWHQGESDAQTAPLSSAWESRLTNHIALTRTTLGRTVPFYLPKLHTGAGGAFNTNIRTSQANLQTNLQRVKVIDLDSLAIGALHYTADQYAKAGVIEAVNIMSDLGINDPPFAQFSWSWSGTTVTFTDASTAGSGRTIASRTWDFGDGSTSTSTNPVHVYGALGTYTVTETVKDDLGASNTMTRLVTCAAGNWTVDSLSGKAMPANATEWAAVFTAAGLGFSPNSAYRPGVPASGNIPDDIGAIPLDVIVGTPQYQSPVPNWASTGFRTINNVTDSAGTINAALPDMLTTSCLAGVYVGVWTTPTSNRGILDMGTTPTQLSINNANPPRIVSRSNTQATTGTADILNDVNFYMLRHNRTANTCRTSSNTEPVVSTAFATSVTGKRFRLGLTSLPSPGAQYLLAFRIDGANAEMTDNQCKTLGNVMGWVMP